MVIDINQYYVEAESGKERNNINIMDYLKSFPKIVVWGASYLGKQIVQYLQTHTIHNFTWWDIRAEELKKVDNIPIISPFPSIEKSEKEHTLVILCIGNTAIMPNLLKRLEENEYFHVLRGDKVYMGELCPFSTSTGIDGLVCNGTMTCRSMFCSRLHNIVKKRNDNGGVFLENLTFMITTCCSLKCKYCCAYMNSYPSDRRKHIPYAQIANDIDAIFSSVDSIGAITIQGGEPFLHPEIDRIVSKILEKNNFGIVSIATNGIFKISKEKLKAFQDKRLNVAFSGYYDALPESKLDIYYKNIELLKENDVPVTVGVKMAEWMIPPSLWKRNYSEDIMRAKKSACKTPERCMQVMDGKLYPCLYSASLHGIGVADYSDDYVKLSETNLSELIKKLASKPYYLSCGHCGGSGGSTGIAGEQGFHDFITMMED